MIGKHTFKQKLATEAGKIPGSIEGWLSIGINTAMSFIKLWAGLRIAS